MRIKNNCKFLAIFSGCTEHILTNVLALKTHKLDVMISM